MKKKKLKENIKYLEDSFLPELYKSINELKIIYEQMNENKEKLKEEIRHIFTRIKTDYVKGKKNCYWKLIKNFLIFFLMKEL